MFSDQYEFFINDFEKKLEFIKDRKDLRLIRGDFKNFIEDLFTSLGQSINIREIEKMLNDIQQIDFSSIKEALKLFDRKEFMGKEFVFDNGTKITFKDSFDDLSTLLNTIQKHESRLGMTEILLRLEWVGNSAFEQMIYLLEEDAPVTELKKLLNNKLNILGDNDIKILWAHIKGEFGEKDFNFEYDETILDKNFFASATTKQLRERIAQYISELRPKILLKRFKIGRSTSPILSFGIARILAIKDRYLRDLTFSELAIAKIINRIVEFCSTIYHFDKNKLFLQLGISSSGRIASLSPRDMGDDIDNAWFNFSSNFLGSHKVIFCELRRLLNIVNYYITHQTDVEKSLKQYKVRYEIFGKENNSRFIKRKCAPNELFLQKELCAFLYEKNIYSYGKKFGTSEIDLMVHQPGEVFVLETKIYKNIALINTLENHIKRDALQLSEYLEKEETNSARGILVIYNLTDILIETPWIWIHKRFWILPINISKITACERKKSTRIEESDLKNIIKCISVNAETRKKNKKTKK